jgi:glycosyltransferase involved in cell wall biosynthesis
MTQFHVLSFEGPDPYARAGGLGTRVEGLTQSLAESGREVHLWFVGDPEAPPDEIRGNLHLHRWCQPISRLHPAGVYAGEREKEADYSVHLPPRLLDEVLGPAIEAGDHAVVLAEEWQTVRAVLHLDRLLRERGLRDQVTILWNANNTFGFETIDWRALERAARITTVSRYMKHGMRDLGVEALVIPNGLAPDAFAVADWQAVLALRMRFQDRLLLSKMARWDPDKSWLGTMETAAALKQRGWRPLLIARGGGSPYGAVVLETARRIGLEIIDRKAGPGPMGLVEALRDINGADVVNLESHVDPEARRTLFRASDAVLANSSHEPFGLVGLETMAAGGVACTGCSGEDYAVPGQNALVLETGDPCEFISLYERLHRNPAERLALQRAGRATAKSYAWPEVVNRALLPRIELASSIGSRPRPASSTGRSAA